MTNFCCLKDCDNYHSLDNGSNIDCIAHYARIMQDSVKNILLHYEAMKEKMQLMDEKNVNKEKAQQEKRKRPQKPEIDMMYRKSRKLSETDKSASTTSPESHNPALPLSPTKQNRKAPSVIATTTRKKDFFGKENHKKIVPSKSTTANVWLSTGGAKYQHQPQKEKQKEKQKSSSSTVSKLFKAHVPRIVEKKKPVNSDTSGDELRIEKKQPFVKARSIPVEIVKPPRREILVNSPPSQNTFALEQAFMKLDKNATSTQRGSLPSNRTHDDHSTSKLSTSLSDFSNKPIKQEKSAFIFGPPSPDLFGEDSCAIVEPSTQKDIFTIPDFTHNPNTLPSLMSTMEIHAEKNKYDMESQARNKRDSIPESYEDRTHYRGECFDCQLHYDSILQQKGAADANSEILKCPSNCPGYQERKKKLGKTEEPRGIDFEKLVYGRRKKKDEEEEENPNASPAGFWDLNVSPRKSKPLNLNKYASNFDRTDFGIN